MEVAGRRSGDKPCAKRDKRYAIRNARSGRWICFGILILLWLGVLGAASSSHRAVPTPFLRKPFSGSYPITSYFDHHHPNMDWDDQVVVSTGLQANAIDGIANRNPLFQGGYWSPDLEDYVYYDGHDAYDYDTGKGVTILAAADGEVTFAGEIPSGCKTPAKLVIIQHKGGYRTLYLHLDHIAVGKGPVFKGQPIGISGETGCVTGPHLHFAVQHNGYDTDPYGWGGRYPDPLLNYSGEEAAWLWEEEGPPPPEGRIISPKKGGYINGPVPITVELEDPAQKIARAIFHIAYDGDWHEIGADEDEKGGWSLVWDPAGVEDQPDIWFHAWLCDADGRCNTGLPIVTDVTLDRIPPEGRIISPSPGATVNDKVAIYMEAEDEGSGVSHVDFYAGYGGIWHKIGRDESGRDGWRVTWEVSPPLPKEVALLAIPCDRAGNCNHFIRPVKGIALDRKMPGGRLTWPPPGKALSSDITVTLENLPQVSEPAGGSEVAKVAFYVRYDGEWHELGVDEDGSDGWEATWNVSKIKDQNDVRFRASLYDRDGRYNDALEVITGVILDRRPPAGVLSSPKAGAFINRDLEVETQASDAGSGVAKVVFYAGYDEAWHEIGVDEDGEDGWAALWDVSKVKDQKDVWFRAEVYDRLSYQAWTPTVKGVTLDRKPPEGNLLYPKSGVSLEGTISLVVEAEDELSGVDRVIFYVGYGGRWHNLGADTKGEDGWRLTWDSTQVGYQPEARFTAWIYDRAGNYLEVEPVVGVELNGDTAGWSSESINHYLLGWGPTIH
ncbi:MAG: Ig-like domain-containing protein [Anaerolineae bacterium]